LFERGYFTGWRINNAKLGIGLLRNDLKRDAINKRLMKMILSSTIGKIAYGMKLLKSHNDELNKLYGNKVDMVKRILNMFQTKTIIGLQNIALKKLKVNNRDEIQKNKIMNALLKSTVFQMNEMLQRLKEHRIKCIFDEKISDSVKQRIINN
jgi:ABC-type polar amino acid transport system ATPase subunit